MKTLKLALVAMFVAFTMVSISSYADGFKQYPKFQKVINLKLDKAIQNPGLVQAMYQQIRKEEVLDLHQYSYAAIVRYRGDIYRISGTREQWMRFFVMDGIPPVIKVRIAGAE